MPGRDYQQHRKISTYLRGLISSGELKPGDQLPSEAELCERFSTSRGPVRQAMATLRNEGSISSGRGRRSVVLGAYNAESFGATFSATEWLKSRGMQPTQKTLWLARRPAPSAAASALRINTGDPVVFVHRIRFADGAPLLLERLYFPLEAGQDLLNFDADTGSIHEYLLEHGMDIHNVHRNLTLGYATAEDGGHLGIAEGTPVWALSMDLYNQAGQPVEYAEYIYRSDRMEMSMTSVRGGNSPLEVIVTES